MHIRKKICREDYPKALFDIPYSEVSHSCLLDLYKPEGEGPFPLIVSIHGGAFKKCDKEDEEMILDMLHGLKRGYAVAGVNYRLSGEAQFPEPVKDIKEAILFLKSHADEYDIDPERIVTWGGSAGGYFSLMAGLIDCYQEFDPARKYEVSSQVQGVVAQFPPVDFTKMDGYLKDSGLLRHYPDHDEADSPESLFIGAGIKEHPDKVQKANPENYIHAKMCPMLIQHGRADHIVPYQGSQHFADLVNQMRPGRATYEIFETADHGDPQFSTEKNVSHVLDFIDALLK